jgi:hypothetical protein
VADSAKKTAYLPQTARQTVRTRFKLMAFGKIRSAPLQAMFQMIIIKALTRVHLTFFTPYTLAAGR